MSAKALFARLLQAANKGRGLGSGFKGSAPLRTGFQVNAGNILGGGLQALGGLGALNRFIKGDVEGAAADAMLMAPLKYFAPAGGLLLTTEGLFPRSAGDGTLRGKPISLAEDLNRLAQDRARGDRAIQQSGGRTGEAYIGTGLQSDNPFRAQTGLHDFGGTQPVVLSEPPVDGSTLSGSNPRNTDLPVSAEQVAPVDPYAYQLSMYGQGRQAANTQEAMDKVRDLGLAINRAQNPQFYRESFNPLMAATFPERYQKTADNFVVQGGIQVPSAMTDKDSRAELLQSEQEANIERLDEATSAMERLLEDLKRKGGN